MVHCCQIRYIVEGFCCIQLVIIVAVVSRRIFCCDKIWSVLKFPVVVYSLECLVDIREEDKIVLVKKDKLLSLHNVLRLTYNIVIFGGMCFILRWVNVRQRDLDVFDKIKCCGLFDMCRFGEG